MMQPPKKGMSTGQILLISGALLVFFVVGGIGAAAYWFSHNKDRIAVEATKARTEAATFAASHEQNACIDEGLARIDRCEGNGIWCSAQQQLFLDACLQDASPSSSLCSGVPKAKDFMKSASWTVAECKKRGRTDQACTNLLQSIPRYCESK